jgi:gamma-glutamyltranspeptidase/glutathione hydrolase
MTPLSLPDHPCIGNSRRTRIDLLGTVELEPGVSPEVHRALEAKGHKVVTSRVGFGGYQAIRIDTDRGVLIGGSDPRKDGGAVGY